MIRKERRGVMPEPREKKLFHHVKRGEKRHSERQKKENAYSGGRREKKKQLTSASGRKRGKSFNHPFGKKRKKGKKVFGSGA